MNKIVKKVFDLEEKQFKTLVLGFFTIIPFVLGILYEKYLYLYCKLRWFLIYVEFIKRTNKPNIAIMNTWDKGFALLSLFL